MFDFLSQNVEGSRNAVLVMPANKVIAINNLQRIDYSDMDSFLADGMSQAKRVLNGDSEHAFGTLYRIFLEEVRDQANLAVSPGYSQEFLFIPKFHKVLDSINSVSDFVKAIRYGLRVAKQENGYLSQTGKTLANLSDSELANLFRKYVGAYLHRVFGSAEGEWLVVDEKLRVPKGSVLFVLTPAKFKNLNKHINQQIDLYNKSPDFYKPYAKQYLKWLYALKRCGIYKRYRVKFIDVNRWKKALEKFNVKTKKILYYSKTKKA